ncbi:TIGR03862 family flavoprotein [Tahibacter soli]|uniref:TIGR03862 family flavoprotein n=1 Tax=Tahibacter soli TaxID=2983605 RepID=A0A9X4BJQ2_9GAMM|nr:TIGR03862 family flavoprotein [Tahibacter soli]MDC8012389.1 TIGR03862 family flavoprotein [Tahibacter soli]
MSDTIPTDLAVIGGGPAGLMAAEVARAAGLDVDLYDAMGSVGRKFLVAGKGGLNLTHSEPFEPFVARYGERAHEVRAWLDTFDADALRAWARGLGVETFVGTSGRVFPADLKAAPLLRGWVRRLRASGVRLHMHRRFTGWDDDGALRFVDDGDGTGHRVRARALVLALGGGSWPVLGSTGAWTGALAARGVDIAPLAPSNCGFDVAWTAHFAERHAGSPVKPVVVRARDAHGGEHALQGEFVVANYGVEGSLIYALSARLRDAIARDGGVEILLDLAPGRDAARLAADLARPRGGRSLSEHLRRVAGIAGVKAGLVYERVSKADLADPAKLAAAIKALPIRLDRARGLDEAISTAGGVRFEAMDEHLMLTALPGTFCAGEMIDWEAPTGGYLLTASFASGVVAARGAVAWLRRQ